MQEEEELKVGEGRPDPNKKRILIIVAVVVVLSVILGAWFFTKKTSSEEVRDTGKVIQLSFLPLDPLNLTLNSSSRLSYNLHLGLTLELEQDKDREQILALMPRIKDILEIYLRGLRIEDFQGGEDLHALKEELALRINKSIYPMKVKSVLFSQIKLSNNS